MASTSEKYEILDGSIRRDAQWKKQEWSSSLSLLCLLAVLPAVLFCLFLTVFLHSTKRENVSTSAVCRFVSQSLRSKLDETKDPCTDFYSYVCGEHKGISTQASAHYLAKWMQSLNLDFINETRLATVDPVDMIVRCALDLGVPAILTFDLDPKTFYRGRRVMTNPVVGEKGLRYLVAWTVYKQLVNYTLPYILIGRKCPKATCFVHTSRAMHLAIVSPYLKREALPDVDMDHLFPSWIKAVAFTAHILWTDQSTFLYDETAVNAWYAPAQNSLIVSTAIIQRPYYSHDAPPSLNYGALGSLRQKAREETLDHASDSENLADIVGAQTAYGAFAALPRSQRARTLVGINASAERLFFISYCAKFCASYNDLSTSYAPYRSRCTVPLMNMPEFSDAFSCAAGQPMNPADKCNFWA
ncbi:hypothetical protein HPB50_018843 [Hyalomma asiaticum]|uniref:Uncharacterized protein n=1 Tax=Hyalomma asiaticum TaxID=266040 RepID=A0ACB7SIY2_HYAAI|nr:hypothetical protein HPB50_018843 [Hyalomma asiaticum]